MQFRADIYTWIPYPEVPNPIYSLPGGVTTWGPGACGPHFGGDNFTSPPARPPFTGTYRAMQSLGFTVVRFGDAPSITVNTGCKPGTTTVLTAPRAAGGRVCHSLTALVKTSTASVTWEASDAWYQLKMHGEAQDPVPAAVGTKAIGPAAGAVASALTPNLEWELVLRVQMSPSLPLSTQVRYGMSSALNLDESTKLSPATSLPGASGRLIHGLITLRRFPSLVVYLTVDSGAGASSMPLYFADASSRGLGQIVVGQTDVLRQVTW